MSIDAEPFFSWTSRRVHLSDENRALPERRRQHLAIASGDESTALDMSVRLGQRTARLVTFRNGEDDYVALLVGDVAGHTDVPVRTVAEESLLIAGGRSSAPAEILVGVSEPESAVLVSLSRRSVRSQLCMGGPVRDLIASTGVVSVVVDWCDASPTAA